jgi:Putative Flp pilus-assembly TadE/G-like
MRFLKFRNGQMAVVMTLAIVTLLGAMALGTDIAVMYYTHMQLQKGADAAALAGANYLSETLTGESIAATTGFSPGLHPNFPPVISRVRRLFHPSWGVSFVVVVSCSSQFFRPPFTL